jgi:hypothetical protein
MGRQAHLPPPGERFTDRVRDYGNLRHELGHEPTDAEVMERMGCSRKSAERYRAGAYWRTSEPASGEREGHADRAEQYRARRSEREAAGEPTSTRDMAEVLGCSRRTIQRYESGIPQRRRIGPGRGRDWEAEEEELEAEAG